MTTEKEILVKMEAIEKEIKGMRGQIDVLRKQMWERESDLITAKLIKEKLQAELKQFREDNYDPSDVARDEDIERFRKVLPGLMEKTEEKEEK